MSSCCIARTGGRMESLLVLLLIANLAGLFLIWQRQDKQEKHLSKSLEDQADHLSDQLDYRFEQARQASQLDQKDLARYLSCLSCLCQMRKSPARLTINNSNNTVSILPPVLAMQDNHIAIRASHRNFPIYIFVRSVYFFKEKILLCQFVLGTKNSQLAIPNWHKG